MAAPLHLDKRAAFPDDLVLEILVRFPPDDPSCILRASLVCKPWCNAASGPAILRRLHELHGAPPVLGFLHNSNGYPRFVPATATPFSLPLPDRRFWRILDCRDGRALFISASGEGPRDLLLWEPITGYQRRLPAPSEHSAHFVNAAVLCAADGCDHGACHGGPFRVFFTGINEETQRLACVYSSQTGTWGDPTTMEFSPDVEGPAVLVGSSYLYFVNSRLGFILEYDMAKHRLKILLSPPLPEYWSFDRRIVLMPAGNSGLGAAMAFESRLCLWHLEDAGAQWVQTRVIDLANLLPVSAIESLQKSPNAVGFADGANTIFVSTIAGIFTIELHSERVRKVCDDCLFGPLIPVVSFYTPGCKLQTQVGVGVGKEEKAIEQANDLLYQGSKAFKEGDFVDAVDCLGHAHKIMVACYGKFAPECVSTYYKYGYALLRKSQDATVSLCNVPRTGSSEKPVKNTTTKGDQAHSDLVLAMELFSLARAIVEKSPENTMQKVKILFAQADVYLEHKGHLDRFLGLYFEALSILKNLVEPDHPRMVELYFRICFVLELGSMPEDGIPYCEHAISLCKSHTEKLKNNLEALLVDNNASAAERTSEKSALEDEIEFFTGILLELNKKYEELVQAMSIPSPVVHETVNRKSRPGRVSGKLSMLCQEMQLS